MVKFTGRLFAVLAMIAGMATSAEAGLLPVSESTTASGGLKSYAYDVTLTSNSVLKAGDYFTIYDFAGFVAGSNSPMAGFTFSSSKIGTTPPGVLPADTPYLSNLTWTYNGPTTLVGPTGVGTFVAESTFGASTSGSFTSSTHQESNGVVENNITSTIVPIPCCQPQVPEPATIGMLGIGLALAAAHRIRRRRPRRADNPVCHSSDS